MTTPLPLPVRQARWAVAALFWLNGATLASLVPRYPLIQDRLELSNTFFGLAIAFGPLGGLVAGVFTSRMMRRFTSAKVAVWAQVLQIGAFAFVLNAPTAWAFALGVFLMSSTDVYTDIAMNAHGLRVQRLYDRSINNTYHAFWSVGAVSGGLAGVLFAGLGLSLPLHALVMGAVLLAANLALRRFLLPGSDDGADDHPRRADGRRAPIPREMRWHLLALGLIAAFAASVEEVGGTWSALYLDQALDATPAVAGLGFVSLVGAQTVGRFTGDRVVDRLGNRGAARLGCGVATLGMSVALLFPSIPLTLIGFACVGWGVATVVPAVYHTADELPGLPAGTGLTIVNWLLRLAFLVGPPLVGRLSDLLSFRAALAVLPLATLMVVLLSSHLGRAPPPRPPHPPRTPPGDASELSSDPMR